MTSVEKVEIYRTETRLITTHYVQINHTNSDLYPNRTLCTPKDVLETIYPLYP